MFRRLCVLSFLFLLCLFLLAGCGREPETTEFNAAQSWAKTLDQARGSTVRFYMWGGSASINRWVDTYVAGELKKRFDITLVRVPMNAEAFVNKLLTEKGAGKQTGTIDLLWINGENFKNTKEAGVLFGPFAPQLPNFKTFVNPKSAETDFGYPVEGYESPYGRAQFVFEYDSARVKQPPQSFAQLAQWIKEHPGKFTYPQPPDFTGSAFIRQALYATTGGHEQYMHGFDRELYERNAPKLWAYLNEIKPFLWEQGRTYPKESATLDTLFARGEVDFSMAYHPTHAQSMILQGSYPESVRTLVMKDGSIYNTHFTAIPASAPNKAGAMVAADFLLSPEAQLSKYDPKNWGDSPAISMGKLPTEMQARFREVDLGPATLSPEVLASVAVPEIPAAYLELLERDWDKYVLNAQ
ncbi:ABC transporter substrate-binding protein [Salidesulfovibrio onnuriiensis]|uniref:ABC transporter substrate-binding protein n=1 Tax=Salidesulfovibrio onnuriiensis TaxID=2583823 RepID=UPI0011C929F4|nr:ABC transporter substrate-binding protein [Salidesulfovibrio onnuriiensis]